MNTATTHLQRVRELEAQLADLPPRLVPLDARRGHVGVCRLKPLPQVLAVRPRLVELLLRRSAPPPPEPA